MPFGQVRDTQTFFTAAVGALFAHFESTENLIIALVLGFVFNLIAGLGATRRDGKRGIVWGKIRSSIIEFIIIFSITFFLKIEIDLMEQSDKALLIVECLIGVALYIYFKNGIKNLSNTYPQIEWLKFLSNFISLNFKKFAPKIVQEAFNKKEKEEEKENEDNK